MYVGFLLFRALDCGADIDSQFSKNGKVKNHSHHDTNKNENESVGYKKFAKLV